MTGDRPLVADAFTSAVDDALGTDETVQRLLAVVRSHLGMDVVWTSEFVGAEQVFRFVDSDGRGAAPEVGSALPLSGSYCAHVLDGRVPERVPDSRLEPTAALLEVTRELQIGAYLGVPLVAADGSVSGMLCAVSRSPAPLLDDRDVATLRLLAGLLRDLQLQAFDETAVREARDALRAEVLAAVSGESRSVVVQPIVRSDTGEVVALEGLSRFGASPRTPAQWFDSAARVGLAEELELAAARSVLELLTGEVDAGVAVTVNLSPTTLLDGGLEQLLDGVDVSRVVLEVTEHEPVPDYAGLAAALDPWRARGLRVAVDDAGAGYASFTHVLLCRPDLVKVDMSLVRGIDGDLARQALVRAVLDVGATVGFEVVAEGVETEAERTTLQALGVPLLQGYLVGRPLPPPLQRAGTTPRP